MSKRGERARLDLERRNDIKRRMDKYVKRESKDEQKKEDS